ncbi:hypothetical protein [Egbenema bharatensis]
MVSNSNEFLSMEAESISRSKELAIELLRRHKPGRLRIMDN